MHKIFIVDRVKVTYGVFSDVIIFMHEVAHLMYEFMTLETRSGHSLSATSGHYVFINDEMATSGPSKVIERLEVDSGDTMVVVRVMT